MIVVFDANVWVSAMHFAHRQGKPVLALERARNREVIAICEEIQEEIYRILVEKSRWSPAAVQFRLNFLLAKSVEVAISRSVHVCRDPDDDKILECAVVAGAEVIVSGDQDLLVLSSYRGIRILTPAEFLQQNQ